MNKRIDELWGEALDKAVPNTYSSLSWTQVEKIKAVFAELLVKECADIADKAEPYKTSDLIKKHFGVTAY